MNRSWVASLIIACCLATPPLALKIKAYRSLAQVDTSRESRVLDFLEQRHFETVRDHGPDAQFFSIRARRDQCSMDLREVSPRGYDRSIMHALAAGRHLFYVDNGAVSAEQPAWRTWSYLHFRRFAGFFGWPLSKRLTFAVMSSASCTDLDWSALSKRPEGYVSSGEQTSAANDVFAARSSIGL